MKSSKILVRTEENDDGSRAFWFLYFDFDVNDFFVEIGARDEEYVSQDVRLSECLNQVDENTKNSIYEQIIAMTSKQ